MPLGEQVGLIEWVGGTTTLKSLISDEARAREAARGGRSGGVPGKDIDALARREYKGEEILPGMANVSQLAPGVRVRRLTAASACVPEDLLARAVSALSVSSEVYLSMRTSFARSLAVLTSCAHVLGIGDRHLDNFLIEKSSGRVVGIDFGYAFGSATYMLPVPELMGVRLTRQLTSFLRPLDTNVLLKGHMAVAFAALRKQRGDLMRLMEVFISEPIVDWEKHTRKLSAEQRRQVEADADVMISQADVVAVSQGQAAPTSLPGTQLDPEEWRAAPTAASSRLAATPARSVASARSSVVSGGASAAGSALLTKGWVTLRLAAVEDKLRGGNSARLTARDLEESTHIKTPATLHALREIVMGPSDSQRRTLPEKGLTPEQQVDVLVEQATDPNVLGNNAS